MGGSRGRFVGDGQGVEGGLLGASTGRLALALPNLVGADGSARDWQAFDSRALTTLAAPSEADEPLACASSAMLPLVVWLLLLQAVYKPATHGGSSFHRAFHGFIS